MLTMLVLDDALDIARQGLAELTGGIAGPWHSAKSS